MIDILTPILSEITRVGEMAYEKYRTDVQVTLKPDQTPVTNVDHMIHEELSNVLQDTFPDIPIISEEGQIPTYEERKNMPNYWALDPLDGTLDFINETDEFVISLGYINNFSPSMGILHHPVSGKSWVAVQNRGVFIQHHGGEIQPLVTKPSSQDYVILVSAYRNDEDLCNIIVRQRERELNQSVKLKSVGSALKFGYLAEGIANEYLRFNTMKEWDFAAGHCIVNEAGFEVSTIDPKEKVEYGTKDMAIPAISIRK